MDRFTESDSEDDSRDDADRRVSSLVLRPAITSLPSIGGDADSEDDSSTSDTEVVFSSINWSAQESTGFGTNDPEPISPGHVRNRPLPLGPGLLNPPRSTSSPARTNAAATDASSSSRGPARLFSAGGEQRVQIGDSSSQDVATVGSPRPCLAPRAPNGGSSAGPVPARPQLTVEADTSSGDEDTEDGDEDGDGGDRLGLYSGRGWLSGAAGRLANVEERRRAAAAATDADHVAAAARDAAALQQFRLQQQQQQLQQGAGARDAAEAGAGAGMGVVAAEASEAAVEGAGVAAAAAVAVAEEKRREQEAEEERRIARDFHDAILAAESEPLPAAGSGAGLQLDTTVAGLGVDDLDALIARLAAGTADLAASTAAAAGPTAPAAAAAGDAALAASGVSQGDHGSGSDGLVSGLWVTELPAADSLWSDEEEVGTGAVAQPQPVGGRAEQLAAPPVPQLPAQPVVAAEAAPAAVPPPTALATVPPAVPGSAPPLPSSSQQLPPPLPAKFKFFTVPPVPNQPLHGAMQGPPAHAMSAPMSPPPGPAGATAAAATPTYGSAGGGGGGSGPAVQDLRQSIADVVQRRRCEEAAAAAQRESEAKAAAARRRLVDSSSEDSEEEEGSDGGEQAAAAAAVPKRPAPVRPVPPAKPQPQPQSQQAAVPIPSVAPAGVTTGLQPSAIPQQVPNSTSTSTAATSAAIESPAATTAPAPPTVSAPAVAAAAASPAPAASSSSSGDGGATAKQPPSTSVGTDCADLRPASRSVFVCTAERTAEEDERARDIREYLRARDAAAVAAAAAEQQQRQEAAAAAAASAAERRWPEPPPEVAQRVSALAARRDASAASLGEKTQPRRVATFTGGNDIESVDEGSVNDDNGLAGRSSSRGAAGVVATTATAAAAASSSYGKAEPAALEERLRPTTADHAQKEHVEAAGAAASRSFAACTTEGDEGWLAEPAPASVVDARLERGSRLAAAGTVIPLCQSNQPTTAVSDSSGDSRGNESNNGGTVTQKEGPSATTPSASSTIATTANAGVEATRDSSAHRPSALQLPSPSAAAAAAATTVTASSPSFQPIPSPKALLPRLPAAAAASIAGTLPPRSNGGGSADLGRLPAWLHPASCFTLLMTSPSNLPTGEVGAFLEWLLHAASSATGSPASGGTGLASLPYSLPAFSVVGARLLGVPPDWPLLPAAAAAAVAGQPSGTGGQVRVLAVACVPQAGLDPDAYNHEAPAAAAAAAAAQQLVSSLSAVPLSSAIGQAAAAAAAEQSLGAWVTVQSGAPEGLFGPLRLPPNGLFGQRHQPRMGGASAGGTSPSGVSAGAAAAAVSGVGTSTSFVCMVAGGVLQQAHLLAGVLVRAASLGLTLAGFQVLYAAEEGAAAVVAATPHRPQPYTGAAVLALYGGNEPLRRWHAQLGPADARLAARTDPNSLHALYGSVARQITCSYDSAAAAREVAAFFYAGGTGGAGDAAGTPPVSPRLQPPPSALAAAPPAHPDTDAVLGCGFVGGGPVQTQWLALPSLGASQQAQALWCAQHLMWCGFSLRGLLFSGLPATAAAARTAGRPAALQQQQPQEQQSQLVLLLEVRKEEASEQLPTLLSNLPALPYAAGASAAPGAESPPPPPLPLALASLLHSDALRARLAPSDLHRLPQPHVAAEVLDTVAAAAGGGGAALQSSVSLHAPSQPQQQQHHHGEDGIAVVALQARQLHAAAMVLAALAAHVTTPSPNAAVAVASVASSPGAVHQQTPTLTSSSSSTAAGRLELVACRLLRQVPSDVAGCLTALQPQPAAAAAAAISGGSGGVGGASSGAGMRPPQRLVISQPALVAAFHGPAAQERVTRLLQAAAQRLQSAGMAAAATPAAAASGNGSETNADTASWLSTLDKLLREYYPATAAAAAPPPSLLVAVSNSQACAKRALAFAFDANHVFLDAGFHDGVHRPPLGSVPYSLPGASVAAAADAAGVDLAPTPLLRLLSGPEILPAVVALDLPALHRNLLPRLLKQLWREGYCFHAATTSVVQPGGAVAAAMPELAGRPAVLLYVSRSNAVSHLRALTAALAAATPAAISGRSSDASVGSGGGGLYTCDTWRGAVSVVSDLWPAAVAAAADGTAPASRPGIASGASQRRFVRPEGSRLLQLTTMVVAPSGALPGAAGGGGSFGAASPPSLDWPRLADVLEGLHAEGFRLASLRALAATPRDMADLGRASCRTSAQQQHAVHASAAAAAAAASGGGGGGAITAPPPAVNLVLLALARDNAVTSLQILLDAATRSVAGAGAAQQGGRGAAAALAAVAPCVSVSHSPAAAEHQVTALFGEVFGAGGVSLVR